MKSLLLVFLLPLGLLAFDGGTIIPTSTNGALDHGGVVPFGLVVSDPVEISRTVTGTTTPTQTEDRQYLTTSGGSTVSDFVVVWAPSDTNTAEATVTRTSSDPTKIIPDSSDPLKWTFVAAGSASLNVTTSLGKTYSREVTTTSVPSGTSSQFTGYASGSLRKAVMDYLNSKISGKSPANKAIFSTYNPTGGSYVRNTLSWVYGHDLTGVSPYNSASGKNLGITAISPRHVILCQHAGPQIPVGAIIHFVAPDASIVTRTLTAKTQATGYSGSTLYPDYAIGLLDSDLPGTIKPVKFPPDNASAKLPSVSGENPIPLLALDYEEKANITTAYRFQFGSNAYVSTVRPVGFPDWDAFYEPLIGGDSGNPALLLMPDGDAVLFTVWTFGGPGSGTNLVNFKADINSIMTALGGGYQITQDDWSSYNSY